MNHNVIESEHPLVTTIELKVYGNMNNLSVATTIYNWYEELTEHGNFYDIDLTAVASMLQMQMDSNERRWKNAQ